MQIARDKYGKAKMVGVDYKDQYLGIVQVKNIWLFFFLLTILSTVTNYFVFQVMFFSLLAIYTAIMTYYGRRYQFVLIEQINKGDCDSRTSEED